MPTFMKWEEYLKCNLTLLKGKRYKEIYKLCMDAYMEGRLEEKRKALEAYRLQCSRLFGNRCMDCHLFRKSRNCICDGNCLYIKKFKSELHRMDN